RQRSPRPTYESAQCHYAGSRQRNGTESQWRGWLRRRRGRRNHRRVQHVAHRSVRDRVERPARRENEGVTAREWIDIRLIEPHDRSAVGTVAEGFSIVTCDVDLVADGNILQKPEVGV